MMLLLVLGLADWLPEAERRALTIRQARDARPPPPAEPAAAVGVLLLAAEAVWTS